MLATIPLLLFFYLCNRYLAGIELLVLQGLNIVDAFDGVWLLIVAQPLWISTKPLHLLTSLAAVIILMMAASLKLGRKFRMGEEYGSARWGTKKDIAPFISPTPDNNILLTQTESLTMESRCKNPETERNKNVLVIGGSGSGKTRFYVKPNLMQLHSSYVITDPKGTLLRECGKLLEDNNYVIHVLNLNGARGMKQSQHYNPLAYLRNEADILTLVDVLMKNTNGEGKQSGEKFWQDAERLYYCALIGYIWAVAGPEEKNLATLLKLIEHSVTSEEDESYQNPVDILFAELEEEQPDCFAVRQYKKFKLASGKTAKSILISCGARLAPFDISEVRELMEYDELELDKTGDRKTALFVVTSDTNNTFNFIAAMMYSQLFNLLCDKAAYDYDGRLPIHVRFLLDEFANIGRIPDFEQTISVIRSREMSANIILQSKAQLEAVYEKKADIIVDNCDTLLFLGGKGIKTVEDMSKLLGKETIGQFSESMSRGSQKSDGNNYQLLGRELLTPDEIASMQRNKCICHITGLRPFFSDKYDITRHPRYSRLSDASRENEYIPGWIALSKEPDPEEQFYCEEMAEFI